MEKLNYEKELLTENNEKVRVGTHDNDSIIIKLVDYEYCAVVTLTLKEAQRVKRYLEDAITTHIINLEEE